MILCILLELCGLFQNNVAVISTHIIILIFHRIHAGETKLVDHTTINQ